MVRNRFLISHANNKFYAACEYPTAVLHVGCTVLGGSVVMAACQSLLGGKLQEFTMNENTRNAFAAYGLEILRRGRGLRWVLVEKQSKRVMHETY